MSKDKKKYSGFQGDCSEDMLKTLDQFKIIVINHNGGVLDPRWDDIYLLRFLRARKFNIKETQKMWKDFIAWRIKNNVDGLTKYYFPELAQLRKMYPHGYHKFAKNYAPIYIERIGLTNIEQIWKITSPDRLLTYYAMLYEVLLTKIFDACTEQRKRQTGNPDRVVQTCTILDLKDIKLGNASNAYKFVKPASQMAQNNYPQILGNMFILNAPFLFTGIWAIVKMWIDDKTKQKIHILGSGYKKELLKHIDPQNLPDFLDGGKCKCPGGCLGNNIGPWNPEAEQFFPNCFYQTKHEQKLQKKIQQPKTEIEVKPEKIQEKQQKVQTPIKEKKQQNTTEFSSQVEVQQEAAKTQKVNSDPSES